MHRSSRFRPFASLLTVMGLAFFVATLGEPAQALPKKLGKQSNCDCHCISDEKGEGGSLFSTYFNLKGLSSRDCHQLERGGCRIKLYDGKYAAGTIRKCTSSLQPGETGALDQGVDPTNPVPKRPPQGTPATGGASRRPDGIIRTGAGLCLDVNAPELSTNGGRVQAWACNGQPQQLWTYDPTARAVRASSGLCLDVHAGINQNGNRVQVWSCNGQWQQQWTPLKDGSLRSAGGLCLDVHAADQTRNGARVQVWQCNGSQQQRFTSGAFQ